MHTKHLFYSTCKVFYSGVTRIPCTQFNLDYFQAYLHLKIQLVSHTCSILHFHLLYPLPPTSNVPNLLALAIQPQNSSLSPQSSSLPISNSSHPNPEVPTLIPSLFSVNSNLEFMSTITTTIYTPSISLPSNNTNLSINTPLTVKPKRKYQRRHGMRNKHASF